MQVLLLEAGGPDAALELHVPAAFSKLFRGAYDWGYDTVPQPALENRTVFWPRGKTLGGSSSLNAMMWVRGFAADYDEWAETAGPRWSWDALAPYFVRVERTETPAHATQGAAGPQSVEHQRDPRPHTAAFLAAARRPAIRSPRRISPRARGSARRWCRSDAARAHRPPTRT